MRSRRHNSVIRITMSLLIAVSLLAQDKPLSSLPYSPSLNVNSMKRDVDPCANFYQYSCGGWIAQNPIPADQERWSVYAKLGTENQKFLWGLLEQARAADPKRTRQQQEIGDYFNACMDEEGIERAGLNPVMADLRAIEKLRSVDELPALLAKQHLSLGGNMMFNFGSDQDFSNSEQVIAFATAGGLGLPDRDYYLKQDARSDELRKKYVIHVGKMLALSGEPSAQANSDAAEIMAIETALAKASLTKVDQRDPYKLFHKMTFADLQKLTPSFKWDGYIRGIGVDSSLAVNVTEPDFYKGLETLLTTKGMPVWKAYLRWQLITAWASYLTRPIVQEHFEFYSRTLHGVDQQRPRWKRCVQFVNRDLGEALGQVFVEKTFGPQVKQRAMVMTRQIEREMENDLKSLSWMSEPTKKQALDKLHTLVNKIGYPDRWRDYSSIRLDRQAFATNVDQATLFESKRTLAKIGKPLDRGEWGMTPPTVNAYYNPQMNDINFPAGVLQPPLFDAKLDDAPNFGNTGATIGHELTHGFDDEGRQFDARGNLRDWWTKDDAANFQKRADCVIKQYAGYTVIDDIKINSKLTAGEDIADLGGTLLAYLAWQHATADKKLEPIDGLTPDQRFFVGMAQWACGNTRAESKRADAMVDPHSPEEFRINGVVSNMPEFKKAFSCKAGQPMVRENACRVW